MLFRRRQQQRSNRPDYCERNEMGDRVFADQRPSSAGKSVVTGAVKQRNPGRWKQIRDTIIGTSPAGYLGCVAAIRNFDFVARLPAVKLPVLVVCGSGDVGTPPEGNRRIASLVPGARYEEIANALHFPNVEHPETFNRIMLGWLNAQR